jgi:glycosyltransferase involved in cell wall biosynthesis
MRTELHDHAANPRISIIIPTLNRPARLRRLLDSVRNQEFANFECIVVDDGSNAETLAAYEGIWDGLDSRFILHRKNAAARKSGPSFSRNTGIVLARGHFLAFCDDDDVWIRNDHLSTAVSAMEAQDADLFFADMVSSVSDEARPTYYDKAKRHIAKVRSSQGDDVHIVDKAGMGIVLSHRALHSDTIVIEKKLAEAAGCYWEQTRHSEDVDFSFRIVDKARRILFRSTPTAEHEVAPHGSLVQSFSASESALFSYLALLHAELSLETTAIRRTAKKGLAWSLYELSRIAFAEGNRKVSWDLCVRSLVQYPSGAAVTLLIRLLLR